MAEEELDDGTPVTELTVGQLRGILDLTEEKQKLEKLAVRYQKMVEDAKPMEEASKQVFADAGILTSVTSPFRLKGIGDYDKLRESMVHAFGSGGDVLMSVAITPPDGEPHKFPVPG